MTKEELLRILKEECDSGDREADHLLADNSLLEYINDLEIEDAYNAIFKWYA